MADFTSLILYSVIYALILYGIIGRIIGKKYAWVGSIIGVVIAIITVYPDALTYPSTWYSQLTYSYDNLNTTDLSAPVNAMFIMYLSMVAYFCIAGLAVLNKLTKASFRM